MLNSPLTPYPAFDLTLDVKPRYTYMRFLSKTIHGMKGDKPKYSLSSEKFIIWKVNDHRYDPN